MEVFGKNSTTTTANSYDFAANLVGNLLNQLPLTAGELQAAGLSTSIGGEFTNMGRSGLSNADGVSAYLNYILLDETFTFVSAGYQMLPDNADASHQQLAMELIPEQDGYVYIYLTNESQQLTDVYFDDFKVTHEVLIKDPQLEVYRYGFNGAERDDEIKGSGNSLSFTFRIYDPRLGRFLSIDPLAGYYPYYTPYQFAGNTPIAAMDIEGLEPFFKASRDFTIKWYNNNIKSTGTPTNVKSKFELVTHERLKQFAIDNVAQHNISHVPVYSHSKKLGHYDCVTACEASMQILKDDYTIKLPNGGNAQKMGQVWESKGLVGSSIEFETDKNRTYKKGDVVTMADFNITTNIAHDLKTRSGSGDGVTYFTVAFGLDFHGGMVSVNTQTDATTGAVTTTYNIYHQLSEPFDLTESEFNDYMELFLYYNSTTDDGTGTGARTYTPGGGSKVSDGNQKVEFRQVTK